MAEKKTTDWERIELDYRAGLLSLREIAAAHGVSHVAISKRAKRDSWERDLAAKIKARAEALVTKAAVTKEVTEQRAVTERQIIEANAARIAQVRGEHRSDISRMRALAVDLLAELEAQTGNVELLKQLGEVMRSDENVDKLNELYHKIISSSGRVDTLKRLSETLRNLVALEREAYGIDGAPEAPDKPRSLADFYGAIASVPQPAAS